MVTKITGTGDNDYLQGTDGNDSILGGAGGDTIRGGGGDDWIDGGSNRWDNGFGRDYLYGDSGNDTIVGGEDGDWIDGGAGDDSMAGGAGDDYFALGYDEGNDTLSGGDGDDTFRLQVSNFGSAVTVLADGGSGDDLFELGVDRFGDEVCELVATGGTGSDTYRFIGGYESDGVTIADFKPGTGGDRLDIRALLDYSAESGGYGGGNPFDGGLGYVRIVQAGSDTLLQYDPDGADGSGEGFHTVATLRNVVSTQLTGANFVGGIRPDGAGEPGMYLVADGDGDLLQGWLYADTLVGGAGGDTISGGAGDDLIEGGGGKDGMNYNSLYGEAGRDTILGGGYVDWIDGGAGDDSLDGGAGNDYLRVNNGAGNDTVTGGEGDDNLDLSVAYDHASQVVRADGGSGDDVFTLYLSRMGGGTDCELVVTGGAGSDTFVFRSHYGVDNVTITDFTAGAGGDRLDIASLLANAAAQGGYNGGNPFSADLGYLRLVQAGADAVLQYDLDGNGDSGAAFRTVATLRDVDVAQLTADNFVGRMRPDGTPEQGVHLIGTFDDDSLEGTLSDDTIDGAGGADTIHGNGGNDLIDGGGVLTGAPFASDRLYGDAGDDTIRGGVDDDWIEGGTGNDAMDGSAGNDHFQVYSGDGHDTLYGGAGDDTFDVTVAAFDSTQVVHADGGDGDDVFRLFLARYAHPGNDLVVTGGAGADTFSVGSSYGARSLTITDFTAGIDRFDITALLGQTVGYEGGNPYGTPAAHFRVVQQGTSAVLQFDADGARATDGFEDVATLLDADAQAVEAWLSATWNRTPTSGDDSLAGTDQDDTLDGGAGHDTLAGGLGNDTYVLDVPGDVVVELAGAGHDTVQLAFSMGTTYQLAANIEDALLTTWTLTGTDIIGNALANRLTGNEARDTLDGGAGNDTLEGGGGDDVYIVDSPGDTIVEYDGGGRDEVYVAFEAKGTYVLGANVESALVTAAPSVAVNVTGNDLDNWLVGNGAANSLAGGAGNDFLDGGAGRDSLAGGKGDDQYIVDTASDMVSELADSGYDTVQTTVAKYTLGANVEVLGYIGSGAFAGTGNALGNVIVGQGGNDKLSGAAGNDVLIGGGGNDSLAGGADDDLLIASTGTDTVDGGTGNDYLQVYGAFANYARQRTNTGDTRLVNATTGEDVTLRNVEYVQFTDGSRSLAEVTVNLVGTGNDVLVGTADGDTLDGGLGNDTMSGGDGDDVYVANTAGDVIVEAAGEGNDSVQVAFAVAGKFVLAADVENATVAASSKAVTVTGNELDNLLTGNAGANTLIGAEGNDTLDGGAGTDSLAGGTGDDVYVVDVAADVVTEAANGGIDRVDVSAAAYTLGANVENLRFTGRGAFTGTGNALANDIAGGAGNDRLNGGAGDDVLLPGTGVDVIDGGTGTDTVQLAGGFADYARSRPTATDTLLVNALTGESVTLRNVERVQFTDGVRDLADVHANVASIANDVLAGTAGNDTLDGMAGNDTLTGGLGDDTYVVSAAGDVVVEDAGAGIDLVQVAFSGSGTYALAANVENAAVTATRAVNLAGNALANILTGNAAANTIEGGAGEDTIVGGAGNDTLSGGAGGDLLSGGAGADTFVFKDAGDVDTITDFVTRSDKLRFVQGGIHVGDGDRVVEGAVVSAAPGGFKASAEVAIFTADIQGAITADKAAVQIGAATSAYRDGATALFVVDNGIDSAVFLFRSSGDDAEVAASELTQVAALVGAPAVAAGNFLFVA